ncbi:MAG: 16S rRNA (adenine(1518)-N(6)/adenine(1519)-N(6))-dimethyltransferase RsmA [Chthoniobacterales bacterium]
MTLSEIRSALTQLELVPSKGLGQSFLHDQNLARWFADQVSAEKGDHIIEIGPGLGAITEFLIGRDAKITVIERDRRLAEYLATRFSADEVTIIREDATRFDTRRLFGEGRVKVIGNLPYSVSTALIEIFTMALSPACLLVLGLQRELAERLAAAPRTKAYGAMSVCLQRNWNIKILKRFPASVYYPAPKVQSAVVRLLPKSPQELIACDAEFFEKLVRRGFSERRKQLRKLIDSPSVPWKEVADTIGFSETARAEELSVEQWARLANLYRPPPDICAQDAAELFDVVDESDNVIGPQPRGTVHVNNLRHRAVHILIFNSLGELFLQKRTLWKDKNPGKWDSSTAGHVDAGENYLEAAVREIREELGVEIPPETLKPVHKLSSAENTGFEFIQIYRTTYEGPFTFASAEVETGAFFTLPQIRQWLQSAPEDFTPVFRLCGEKALLSG